MYTSSLSLPLSYQIVACCGEHCAISYPMLLVCVMLPTHIPKRTCNEILMVTHRYATLSLTVQAGECFWYTRIDTNIRYEGDPMRLRQAPPPTSFFLPTVCQAKLEFRVRDLQGASYDIDDPDAIMNGNCITGIRE